MEVAPELDSSVFSVVVVMWSVGLFLFGFLQRLFPHGGFLSLIFSLEDVGQHSPKSSSYLLPQLGVYV